MPDTLTRRTSTATASAAGTAPRTRRLSPGWRKLLLAAHVLVGVGWFGLVAAVLVLQVAAAPARDPEIIRAAYLLRRAIDGAIFPPMALGTLVTGVVLSVGTAWGLFQHYWIVAKLALTVAVITTGVRFVRTWVEQAIATGPEPVATPLTYAALAHLLVLGAATVISIYKPWGRIRPDRHRGARMGA